MYTDEIRMHASWDACLPHSGIWLADPGIGTTRVVSKGTMLYGQGEVHAHFYLIRSGFVQAEMTHPNGRRIMLDLMGPGTLFGEAVAFERSRRYISTRAVTRAQLTEYTPDAVFACSKAVPLLESIVKIMASKQRVLASKLLEFCTEEPELRLRNLLARMVDVQRRAQSGSVEEACRIWLSQEMLGEMCGMSRVSAARALRRLNDEGIVRTHPRFVEVIDADRLLHAGVMPA